jgi:hypothetical protein
MKILKNVSLLLLLLSSSVLFARPAPQVLMRAIGDQSFVIDFKQDSPQEVSVSLTDKEGTVLLQEKHTEAHFQKKYVLRELPEGTYVIKLKMNDRLIRQPITMENNYLHLDARQQETLFSPSLMLHGSTLDFSMLNLERKEVKVRLRNQKGITIYQDKLGSRAKLNTRFVLTEFPRGQYTLHTYADGDEFIHSFELADLYSVTE